MSRAVRASNIQPLLAPNFQPRTSNFSQSSNVDLVVGFFGVVFVPLGNFYDDVGGAVGDGLAAEAGFGGDAGGLVELVEFGVGGFVAGFQALLDHDVAGGAGADATAGVVQSHFEAFGNVEDAAGDAVVSVGDFFRVDLDSFAAGQERDFIFLCGGLVFDFVDVGVTAAHFFLTSVGSILLSVKRKP